MATMEDFLFCAKCGSDRVIPDARTTLKDYGSSLEVRVEANPDAVMLKGTVTGRLRARICAACGYTELYAGNLDRLWAAHEQAQRARR